MSIVISARQTNKVGLPSAFHSPSKWLQTKACNSEVARGFDVALLHIFTYVTFSNHRATNLRIKHKSSLSGSAGPQSASTIAKHANLSVSSWFGGWGRSWIIGGCSFEANSCSMHFRLSQYFHTLLQLLLTLWCVFWLVSIFNILAFAATLRISLIEEGRIFMARHTGRPSAFLFFLMAVVTFKMCLPPNQTRTVGCSLKSKKSSRSSGSRYLLSCFLLRGLSCFSKRFRLAARDAKCFLPCFRLAHEAYRDSKEFRWAQRDTDLFFTRLAALFSIAINDNDATKRAKCSAAERPVSRGLLQKFSCNELVCLQPAITYIYRNMCIQSMCICTDGREAEAGG